MKETGNDLTHLACVDANSCVWFLVSLNLIYGGVGDTFSCVGSVAACADAAKMVSSAFKAEDTRLLLDRLKRAALKETEAQDVPNNARKRGALSILWFAELAAVAKLFFALIEPKPGSCSFTHADGNVHLFGWTGQRLAFSIAIHPPFMFTSQCFFSVSPLLSCCPLFNSHYQSQSELK